MACSICRKDGHNKRNCNNGAKESMNIKVDQPSVLFTDDLREIILNEILPSLDEQKMREEFNKVKDWLCEGSGLTDKDAPKTYQDLIGKGSGEAGRIAGIVSYYTTNIANKIISDCLPGWEKSEVDGYDAIYVAKNGSKNQMEQKTSLKYFHSNNSKDWTGNGCSKKQGSYFFIQLLIDEKQPLNRPGDFIKKIWLGFAPVNGVTVNRGKGESDRATIIIKRDSELITRGLVKLNPTKKSPIF